MPDSLLPDPQPSGVSFEDMLAEVDRELKLRRRVYPRWVDQGNLTKATADQQILKMQAVRRSLLAFEALSQVVNAGMAGPLDNEIRDHQFDVELLKLVQRYPETA